MRGLMVEYLRYHGCLGDNKELKEIVPSIEQGEQVYTALVRHRETDKIIEHPVTNSELLEHLYDRENHE